MIEFILSGLGVMMFCAICHKITKHRQQQDSKFWESFWCEECHVGKKYKTK